jgi:hypothetical protein
MELAMARKRRSEGSRRRHQTPRKRERRQGCQRLDRKISKHRGKTTPTLAATDHREVTARGEAGPGRPLGNRMVFGAIRRSGCGWREPSLPPALPHGAKDSVGCPRDESRESGLGTREVRVHVVRLGGRRRLDASRVLSAGRSRGLVASQGASRKEARSTA